MDYVKNAFSKKAKRRQQKQCVEKLRRDNIKKSIEELALLIPEARKQIAHGHRLQQSKILQLVVDYVRSSQQENNGFSQPSNDRTIDDKNSNEYGCPCTFCEEQFEQCAENTKTFSPSDDDPDLQLPLDSQHSRYLCSSREEHQHSPSDQSGYNISSREESPFEEGDVSGSLRSMSFLESPRQWSSKSNMASIEAAMEDVAMETTGTPPLRALNSLCSSISPDIFPAVSVSRRVLSRETSPSCTRNSDQFVLDSVLQKPRSYRLIPQAPPPSYDEPPRLVPESRGLWRPWIA